MKAIKRFLLKIVLLILVLAMVAALAALGINSHVKSKSEENISYIVSGEVEINPLSFSQLREFDADCIMVLGAGI